MDKRHRSSPVSRLAALTALLAGFVLTVPGCEAASPLSRVERIADDTIAFPAIVTARRFERRVLGMPGYHFIVWNDGRAAPAALFQAAVSDVQVIEALESLGAKPGNSLDMDTWDQRDDPASKAPDKIIQGPRVDVLVRLPGRREPLTIDQILLDPDRRGFAMRFGGHRANIHAWHSGCIVCLYSCPGSKIGNARYTVRDYTRKPKRFRLRSGVLPNDGTEVTILLRLDKADVSRGTTKGEPMLFERFEDKGLAQYSYAVGCPKTGKVAIVDPRRDVDIYLRFAEEQSLEISQVLETHVHADYASGARELAERTGAELLVSGHDQGETYQVSFPHRDFMDGETLEIGSARIEALHTPGHTPEHLSFLVYDLARSKETAMLMLSGDFLLIGSLGRPDLLGEAETRALAGHLFASVREKLTKLPDGLEIHPAHGAGSMCSSGMSGRPVSTLGFERAANPYLNPKLSQPQFVDKLLSATPPFPDYYRRMKKLNSEGPALLHGLPGLQEIEAKEFHKLVDAGHVVIDVRDQLAFGGGHIPDSFGIGFGPNLSTWAAWVVPADRPILLVPGDSKDIEDAVRALVRVGLDDIRGSIKGGIAAWREAGLPLSETPQTTPAQLQEMLQGREPVRVLDVRTDQEWESGHIEGALHIPGGDLSKRAGEIPTDGKRLAVICGSGYRSTVAASVLERAGFRNLLNVTGGMGAWQRAGLPVAR